MDAAMKPSCAILRREGFFVVYGVGVVTIVDRGNPGESGVPPWRRS
jgi:hypothetical protein